MKMKARRMLAAAATLAGAAGALGQSAPIASQQVPVHVASGLVQNTDGLFGAGNDAKLVYAAEVRVPMATWLRLAFDDVLLSGFPEMGNGSYLIITSMQDGYHQRLDARSVRDWNNTSAYFNGEAVMVELFAYPGTGVNQISMSDVTAGPSVGVIVQPETICGPVDNRTLSTWPHQGRLMPVGCTGWMITNGTCANRFLTAGHCIATTTTNAVMQFNVPLSTSTGGTVNPPPEHQYPVVDGSIQSVQTVIGNDWAQFFTHTNSNTGLHAREAQGGAAYSLLSAPAPSGQTLRITGYGTTSPNDPVPGGGLPLNQSQVQKTHTGPFTSLIGTRMEYQVDTTGGNSGSPITLGTGPDVFAIGIHTNAGCDNPTGSTANSGTAIQNAGLQAALAAPLGPCAPYVGPTCLQTIFASNNGGSAGGAVYFDVTVGANPIQIRSLFTNVDSVTGTSFSMDIYTTPDTAVGKESNAGAWTQVAQGNGIADDALQGPSLVALENRFVLQPFRSYGIALVLNSAAGHDYTDGTGTNQTYSNSNLTINCGSASNTPFGSNITPRVWNGRFCYDVLPANGNCATTLYATNNGLSTGSTVFFDVDVLPGAPISVAGIQLNNGDAAGTPFNVTVHRAASTHVGKELTPASWVQVATGSGISAGSDVPSYVILNSPFNLAANSSQGLAINITGGSHDYTNGDGNNEIYFDGKVRLTGGAATSGLFTGSFFEPRVFNGAICYHDGLTACTNDRFAQSPPNSTLGSFNSNVASGVSTQQEADDFIVAAGGSITRMTAWATYTGTNAIPSTQDFTVNIFSDSAGVPGSLLFTGNVSNVAAQDTGLVQTFFTPDRPILQFDIDFPGAFQAAPGVKYWVSVLGTSDDFTWAWQLINSNGAHAVRGTAAAAWVASNTGDFAFELCGGNYCYADCNNSGTLTIADFGCFQNAFAAGLPYANCNGAGGLTIADFGCFQASFAAGCP